MPAEVILMFDVAGVLTSSPFPAARRLAEFMMRCVFERAAAHFMSLFGDESPSLLAQKYSNFFTLVETFTKKARCIKTAYEQLELGQINRLQFISMFSSEIDFMLIAFTKKNIEELELLQISKPKYVIRLRERYPLLTDSVIQELLREVIDTEAFLCTIERISPRRNVLNLLHYLRMKSYQEIRIVVITNGWEIEGEYAHMHKALLNNVNQFKSSLFSMTCPIDYGTKNNNYNKQKTTPPPPTTPTAAAAHSSSFDIHSIFDEYVQSSILHKRKPFPDIFLYAIDKIMKTSTLSKISLQYGEKPYIFLFDDILANCETAKNLSDNPFTKVYYIENGAYDVYEDILNALKIVGEKDLFWFNIVKDIEKDIGPLFKPPCDLNGNPTSWINEEMNNYNSNLLFLPPPPCEACEYRGTFDYKPFLDDNDKDAILFYCAQHLPHLFPFDIPNTYTHNLKLAHQPGFATSSGPVIFEPMKGIGFFKTYRISLRTGNYVLRLQPRGPTPYGSINICTEYEVMQYLNQHSTIPVAKCLLYCGSYSACGHRFFLRRFIDGEVITNITKLIQPRIQRSFSKRRQWINIELDPHMFFKKAIDILAELHNVPLPSFLSRIRIERNRHICGGNDYAVHPLLEGIKEWINKYKNIIYNIKQNNKFLVLFYSKSLEQLSSLLLEYFDITHLEENNIPLPTHLVFIHGDYTLRDLLFTYRSFEGQYKYPPELVGMMNFKSCGAGDPLIDLASLALLTQLRPPFGICGLSSDIQALFPSPEWILDRYCNMCGYMRELTKNKREKIFNVYISAMCLRYAVTRLSHIAELFRIHGDLSIVQRREFPIIEHVLQQGLLLLGRQPSNL